jgi:hypothetical protein
MAPPDLAWEFLIIELKSRKPGQFLQLMAPPSSMLFLDDDLSTSSLLAMNLTPLAEIELMSFRRLKTDTDSIVIEGMLAS